MNSAIRRSILKANAAFLGLFVAFFIGCGGSGQGTGSASGPTDTPPGPASVSGTITDRISGVRISGSTIQFKNLTTNVVTQASVGDGSYQLTLQPGPYEVVITGPTHLEHKAVRTQVSGGSVSFTVIGRGSQFNGVAYDDRFDAFFNMVARTSTDSPPFAQLCPNCGISKWDVLPRDIYVMQPDPGVMSPVAFDGFMALLQEVDQESVPLLFGGRIGPLAIAVGPPIQRRDGTIRVEFFNSATEHPTGGTDCSGQGPDTRRCGIFRENTYDWERWASGQYPGGLRFLKNNILHELYHIAFARHVFDGQHIDTSVMGGSNQFATLQPDDVFACWLVYHPDTHPGNKYPDSNP